jgi:large subunit ribosomal protein L11
MAAQTVDVLVEGGKATAAPPLGPALGPTGVNIGQVIAKINEKTAAYKGMQVPVKVTIETTTKTFEISIGTPPASALIKKESGAEKGSGNPKADLVADLKIEQIIKIALMKESDLLGKDLTMKVREVIGTCQSMGIMVEGMRAQEALKAVEAGTFDKEITARKTEISAEELKALAEERKRLEEEMKARYGEFLAKAKSIAAGLEGKEKNVIRKALEEAGIPQKIVDEVAPPEAKVDPKGGKGGKK